MKRRNKASQHEEPHEGAQPMGVMDAADAASLAELAAAEMIPAESDLRDLGSFDDLPPEGFWDAENAAAAGVPEDAGHMTDEAAQIPQAAERSKPSQPQQPPIRRAPPADPSAPEPFDVCTAPLMTPTLLEASAGTGKTFSIKHLALRFAAEEGIPVTAMLIMTFTKAATAELKTRIQAHFSEMLALYSGEMDEAAADALLLRQRALWREAGIEDRDVILRLRESLSAFDNAGIYTIHSFCQTALRESDFSSGGPVGLEIKPGRDAAIEETADEFLRRALAQYPDENVRRRLAGCRDWGAMLEKLVRAPDALVRRSVAEEAEQSLEAECPDALEVLRRFLSEAPALLARKRIAAGVRTYDDMLCALQAQLDPLGKTPEAAQQAERFAERLRSRYRAVLVDEFQDTDPVQFDIISRLFLSDDARCEGGRAVWFVGDPKQAIYSFRGADLETYLRAKEIISLIGRREVLETNYRSVPALVEIFNAFWTASPEPFLRADLNYIPVNSSPANTGLWRREGECFAEEMPFEWIGTWKESGMDSNPMKDAQTEALCRRICSMIERGRRGELLLAAAPGEPAAAEIEAGGRTVPLRGVEPRDIAVLVSSNDDAAEARDALSRCGVRASCRERESIFNSIEAQEIALILRAYAAPGDAKALRAARVTRLIGDDLALMLDEREDEVRRIALSECINAGARLWSRTGPAPAIERLMSFCRTAERLLAEFGGARALVNYRHLAELLHEAARTVPTPSGLAAWLEQQKAEGDEDEHAMRLESDDNLVRIVTIHSSKGLQYPIVFWLFAHKTGASVKSSCVFALTDHVTRMKRLEVSLEKLSAPEEIKNERQEETVRLAYVAMTRAAKHLCILTGQKETSSGWSAVYTKAPVWLALTGSRAPNKKMILQAAGAFFEEMKDARQTELTEATGETIYLSGSAREEPLSAAPAVHIRRTMRISSFTGISWLAEDEGPIPMLGRSDGEAPADPRDILSFPKGAQAGTCLHEIMELADFQALAEPQAEEGRLALCRRSVERHLSFASEKARADAAAGAAQMVLDLLTAELPPGFRLSDVKPGARAAELEFLLPIPETLTAERLSRELAALSPLYDFGVLQPEDLRGFLTGFIDLAFECGGRFYVLDWKSNRISGVPEGYDESAMAAEMKRHLYRLQYLIYLVALRRFLRVRLRDTFRDEMIGGAIYVFLRGVRSQATTAIHPQGIVFDPVRPEVIARLDALFAGEA